MDVRREREQLRERIGLACRYLLSQQDRDPMSPTRGCLDRRYWAWKLVDFPEATFQRNVLPLAWLLRQTADGQERKLLAHSVLIGFQYALKVQHRNGSFDQAFPHEYSFGATAFLLQSLLKAYELARDFLPAEEHGPIEDGLRRAGDFLCDHDETHGHIANHLAGAAQALAHSAQMFGAERHARQGEALVARILAKQSREGWFQEYEGADPGYQTLCVYYLASYLKLRPDPVLREALDRAVAFLAWFVHPDGSFGGEYGSRRTAIFYPGGIALLSRDNPLARRMLARMLGAIAARRTVTLDDIDFGNFAPLLSNYLVAVDETATDPGPEEPLPWEAGAAADFPQAGLFVRSTPAYYAVLGASNGGVLKVFDRGTGRLLCNDGGYVGQIDRGPRITTQVTHTEPSCASRPDEVEVTAPFYVLKHSAPSPLLFVILRVLNLTLMRSIRLGNFIKALMVRTLITGKKTVPLDLVRRVTFRPDRVEVHDRLSWRKPVRLRWLACGVPFVSIHMASARYFHGYDSATDGASTVIDLEKARAGAEIRRDIVPCRAA